ncbi:MAG: TatD family hydrolase [Fibrobacteria bacterium]|nr:TatD family hydrolase [Fibrobacteria bacterium]
MTPIIEPHIHMYSRTTDDYQNMYNSGIRVCVEPSFWLGADRRYAGTFFDYFSLILDFETIRASRFGIDHFCAVALNPKEAEDTVLADEVISGLKEYLAHPRCVALGEIGFNNITQNEESAFVKQFELAKELDMPVIVHLPHVNKKEGAIRSAEIVKELGVDVTKVVLDHNTEETIEISLETGCWAGMTVYPISKLTPERVSNMIKQYGSERIIVNGSADWGVSDPLSLVKVVDYMGKNGHEEKDIKNLVYNNAMAFYKNSPNWKPDFDIKPMDPREFQR